MNLHAENPPMPDDVLAAHLRFVGSPLTLEAADRIEHHIAERKRLRRLAAIASSTMRETQRVARDVMQGQHHLLRRIEALEARNIELETELWVRDEGGEVKV